MMLSLIEGMWLLPGPVVKNIAQVRNATTLSAPVLAGVRLGLALGAWVVAGGVIGTRKTGGRATHVFDLWSDA